MCPVIGGLQITTPYVIGDTAGHKMGIQSTHPQVEFFHVKFLQRNFFAVDFSWKNRTGLCTYF